MRHRTMNTPALLSSTGGIALGLVLAAPLAAHGSPTASPDDENDARPSRYGATGGGVDAGATTFAAATPSQPSWADISSTRPLPTLALADAPARTGARPPAAATAPAPAAATPATATVAAPTLAAATVAAPTLKAAAAPTTTYTVAAGDTVSDIAQAHGLATASVLAVNGLSWSSTIFPGQVLTLTTEGAPSAPATPATGTGTAPEAAPAPAPGAAVYTVATGDTLSGIAGTHGVSLAALFAANGLHHGDIIYPGQRIALPGLQAVAAATPAPPASPAPPAAAPAPAPKPAPAPAPPVIATLDAPMTENARLIIATGRSIGASDQAIVVALAAAMQESSMRNIDHGDRDSLGLFQQRPSQGWGTPEQVRDRQRATLAFFGGRTNPNTGSTTGLFDVPGWESMSVTEAAQAVQKSAHPDEYAKWEASARAWLAQLG